MSESDEVSHLVCERRLTILRFEIFTGVEEETDKITVRKAIGCWLVRAVRQSTKK